MCKIHLPLDTVLPVQCRYESESCEQETNIQAERSCVYQLQNRRALPINTLLAFTGSDKRGSDM